MKTILTILLLSISFVLFSQETKTYKGEYENGYATYQYYENSDYERVFNGKFSYKNTTDNPAAYTRSRVGQIINISGSFKNNKKSGLWTSKEVLTNLGNKQTTIWKGHFINGNKTGSWSFSMNILSKSKPTNINATFNFLNNTLVGEVIIKGGIKGSLDKEGGFIGAWNIKSNDGTEYIAEFKNNVFTKLIVRNISDGGIFMKYICDSAYTFDKTQYELVSCKELKNTDETHIKNIDNKYFAKFFGQVESIRGLDKTLNTINLGSSTFTIISPKVAIRKKVSAEEIKRKQIYNKGVQFGDNFFSSKDYSKAIIAYKKAIEAKDKPYPKEQIKKCDSLIIQVSNEKYNNHINLGNQYYEKSNYPMAITEFQNALKIKETEEYPKQQINAANTKIKELKEIEREKKEIERKKRDAERIEREIVKLETEIKTRHNSLIINKALTKKKKNLYNAYLILYNKSNKITDNEEKILHLRNLILLQQNINYLINLSSNSLEKQLKPVSSSDEIWKIIKTNLKLSWYK